MTQAFVYCWKNTSNGRRYIGCHKGKTTDDYVCSSKYMREDYNANPSQFRRQILTVCKTYRDARIWENRILSKLEAAKSPKYYNLTNGWLHTYHHPYYWIITFPDGFTIRTRQLSPVKKKVRDAGLLWITTRCEKRRFDIDYPNGLINR